MNGLKPCCSLGLYLSEGTPAASLETRGRGVKLYCVTWTGLGVQVLGPGLGAIYLPPPGSLGPTPGQAELHLCSGGRTGAAQLPVGAICMAAVGVSPSAFEDKQKLRKHEIVSRILKEEAEEESRKRKPLSPAKPADRLTLRDRTWGYIAQVCQGKTATATPCSPAVSPPSSRPSQGAEGPQAQVSPAGVVGTRLQVDA